MKWRYMTYVGPASFIHASQEVIVKSVGKGISPPTVRIVVFRPPAITIGYFQNVEEEANLEEARRYGLDIMRRPTAGGAIIQSEDAPGWEIYVPETLPNLPADVEESYEYLSRPILEFFNLVGIKAKFRPKNDVEVNGRKISGMGQYRESGGILHTGTFLFDFDIPLMLKVLKLPIEKLSDKTIKSFEERITTVKREKGFKPSLEEVVELFRKAVGRTFHVELEDGELNKFENSLLEETLKRYKSNEWIYGLRPLKGYNVVTITKTPGGLIKVHAKISQKIIESILITGDFFVYPQRAVYDLEAFLKWTHVNNVFSNVKGFFEENKIDIIGLSTDDIAEILCCALKNRGCCRCKS